ANNLQKAFNQLDLRGDIKALQAVYDYYVDSLNHEDEYTTSSWEAFSPQLAEVLEAAEAYLAEAADAEVAADINQKEVDDEKAKIMNAYEKLALRGDATDLSDMYESYAAQLADARENAT